MFKRMKMVVNSVLLKIVRGVFFNTCNDSLVFRKNIAKTVCFFSQNNASALFCLTSAVIRNTRLPTALIFLLTTSTSKSDPANAKQKSPGLLRKNSHPNFYLTRVLFDQTMLSPGICFDFKAHLTDGIFKGSPLSRKKINRDI